MPGETGLTRMPREAYSMASDRVAAARPPLVVLRHQSLPLRRRTAYSHGRTSRVSIAPVRSLASTLAAPLGTLMSHRVTLLLTVGILAG